MTGKIIFKSGEPKEVLVHENAVTDMRLVRGDGVSIGVVEHKPNKYHSDLHLTVYKAGRGSPSLRAVYYISEEEISGDKLNLPNVEAISHWKER